MNTATIPFSRVALRLRQLNALTADPNMTYSPQKLDEFLRRRTEIAEAKPNSDIDALSMLVMAESAADTLMRGNVEELQQEGVNRLGAELLAIVWTLSKSFERKIGLTAAELGLRGEQQTH